MRGSSRASHAPVAMVRVAHHTLYSQPCVLYDLMLTERRCCACSVRCTVIPYPPSPAEDDDLTQYADELVTRRDKVLEVTYKPLVRAFPSGFRTESSLSTRAQSYYQS